MQLGRIRDVPWPLPDKCNAVLLKFDQTRTKPSFEEYKASRSEQGSKNPLLDDSQLHKQWSSYCDYLDRFCGLCRVGETLEIIKIEYNVIAMSKNWTGAIKDGSDLELWLRTTKKHWYSLRTYFSCEVYSFGTIAAARPGSIEDFHGESRRDTRISHSKGIHAIKFDNPVRPTTLSLSCIDAFRLASSAVFQLSA